MNDLETDQARPIASWLSTGRLAEIACLLEVTARKPGNVHRFLDFKDLHFVDFLLSATAIAAPLDRAVKQSLGATILAAVEATCEVVSTNTNLGMILLLAPLAAVPRMVDLAAGVEQVLAVTTRDDARETYRAIRLARPGGLGQVPDQDVAAEPSMTLREVMALAADRDLVARQYANGFREVLHEALPMIGCSIRDRQPLETAIITAFLGMLARHPDSLIVRKVGLDTARIVTSRAAGVLDAGWPAEPGSHRLLEAMETWLLACGTELNPGTTADLVTAALFAALRDGTIQLPRPTGSATWSRP